MQLGWRPRQYTKPSCLSVVAIHSHEGVCSYEVHIDYVEILNIAVSEKERNHGIGRNMIDAVAKTHIMAIEAETDDDAVGFYRKCGFEASAIQKYNTRRWVCTLRMS
jgi:ribosomal protein S18 acetylase RimI-like enzyme